MEYLLSRERCLCCSRQQEESVDGLDMEERSVLLYSLLSHQLHAHTVTVSHTHTVTVSHTHTITLTISNHSHQEEEQDSLIHGLYQLQDKLIRTGHLGQFDVDVFVKPFCVIVQSDDTTGPITGMAISSLDKFLAYGLIGESHHHSITLSQHHTITASHHHSITHISYHTIIDAHIHSAITDPSHPSASSGVETLSEAVTHARFVGTNPASDEVVLMKILQVLHTLMLSPVGPLLSNESVCEIMQSCFRICFESRLSGECECVLHTHGHKNVLQSHSHMCVLTHANTHTHTHLQTFRFQIMFVRMHTHFLQSCFVVSLRALCWIWCSSSSPGWLRSQRTHTTWTTPAPWIR